MLASAEAPAAPPATLAYLPSGGTTSTETVVEPAFLNTSVVEMNCEGSSVMPVTVADLSLL